jgi:hypothetical protein
VKNEVGKVFSLFKMDKNKCPFSDSENPSY